MTKTLTATEVVHNFLDILDQVRYQAAAFDSVRSKQVVARLMPPAPAGGVPLDQLGSLLQALPRLGSREADAMAKDTDPGLSRIAALTTNAADFRRMPGCLVETAEQS
jgi:hypothetical protein